MDEKVNEWMNVYKEKRSLILEEEKQKVLSGFSMNSKENDWVTQDWVTQFLHF